MRTLVALLLVVAAGIAGAQPPMLRDCADDTRLLCGDVRPGEGRVIACLRARKDLVSAACRTAIERHRGRVRDALAACQDDVKEHCSDVAPGGGRVVACLRSHEQDLSPGCRERLRQPTR